MRSRNLFLFIFFAFLVSWSSVYALKKPREVIGEEVRIDNHIGKKIDLNHKLTNQQGEVVTLKQYFSKGQPVVIVPVYYGCPMLCSQVLNGVTEMLNGLSLKIGEDFQLLHYSIDPEETFELANEKAKSYYGSLKNPKNVTKGWHFFVGEAKEVKSLSDELGFYYKKDGDEYAHGSAMYLLDTNGKIAHFRTGIRFDPKDIKFSLIDTSKGNIGTFLDAALSYCYSYDPETNKYSFVAMNAMRAGGILTLGALVTMMFILIRSNIKKNKQRIVA